MLFGPDDLVIFGVHYLPSLALTATVAILIFAVIVRAKRLIPTVGRLPSLAPYLTLIPLIVWIMYFCFTCQSTATLVLLGSESAGVAEIVYTNRFRNERTLEDAVRLCIDKHQPPNVRFYAACLVADNLATNKEKSELEILQRIDKAPTIETQFIGGNGLTEKFYVPGHAQPHLTAREIVEQRLQDIRRNATGKWRGP
jgi:hypothetical protein